MKLRRFLLLKLNLQAKSEKSQKINFEQND